MTGIPSDIHSQIVDSFTGSVIDTDPPKPIHHNTLLLKHRRCLIKTAELERKMCAQRIDILRWSNRLKEERKSMLRDIESVRLLSLKDEDQYMYRNIQSLIDNSEIVSRIRDFIDDSYTKNEQDLCQAVESLKRKYPAYQIRSADTIAEAIDILVGIAEVSIEDTNLVNSKIRAVSRETEQLHKKNKELAQLIEQYEKSIRKRGRPMTTEHLPALEEKGKSPNQVQLCNETLTQNGQKQQLPHSQQQKYDPQGETGPLFQLSSAHPIPPHGAHNNKNFLGLTLESVKVRRRKAP